MIGKRYSESARAASAGNPDRPGLEIMNWKSETAASLI